MRTFSARLRVLGRTFVGWTLSGRWPRLTTLVREGSPPRRLSLASEAGDTLIEVLISALLVGLIVVGTFSGLNSSNRSTSIDRARSQADALAEQNEEQLHSLSVTALAKLELTPETKTIKQNGTEYVVTSNAKYVIDNTATTSCSSTALSAEYIQTTSTVYSKSAFGATKPVIETGIVSPPPDTSLIVEVTNQAAEAVPGMEVQVTGPQSATTVTNTNGCAILALKPGEYEINVHLTSYVDPNWFTESKNDTSAYPLHIYLPAQTTTKKEYRFAKAAELKPLTFKYLNPTNGKEEEDKALNATLENTGMAPTTRLVQKEGSATYLSTIHTEKIVYPFKTAYTVYAGSCPANRPPVEKERTTVPFTPENITGAKLVLPSLIVDVWEGTEKIPGKLISSKPEIFLSDTDEGCESTYHQPETIEKQTEKGGALKYPGQPWGTYTVCVNVAYKNTKTGKIENKHVEATGQKNNNPKQAGTVVALYEGGTSGEGLKPEKEKSEESCP
jgi:Tfp pilus assembly protein PilV